MLRFLNSPPVSDETVLTVCQLLPREGSPEEAGRGRYFTNLTQHCRYGGSRAYRAGRLTRWHCASRAYPRHTHKIAPTPAAPSPRGLDAAGVGATPLLRVA
ncbi:hypothetical protein GCM10022295_81030 [Streptomyces osmaniensis]|uniref:Uncharacterized protein n=1 Tax=Streptomyces osmaniensis TaxID=593134 RepID=A0ABP6YR70_9ACTN